MLRLPLLIPPPKCREISTSTSSKKRRNLFASFAPVAKRIGTKVPKGYMFFMSHEIPYNAETARPARLRKKRSKTIVNGRRPLALDPSKNYDMDSDEEWAEQGESLSGDSDIEETTHEENDYEMDDWLCSDEDVEYVGAENNDAGNGDVVDESKTSSTGAQEIRPRKWKPKTKSGKCWSSYALYNSLTSQTHQQVHAS